MLRIVLLCAGYGTRLQRDLSNDPKWNHLMHLPKPLLPIGEEPLVSLWIKQIEKHFKDDEVQIVLVSNGKYLSHFLKWANADPISTGFLTGKVSRLPVHIISDGTTENEARIGAVACMKLGMDLDLGSEWHQCLVIAGDTLFRTDFDLSRFVSSHMESDTTAVVTRCPAKTEELHLRGIIEIQPDGKVVRMLEKPSPEDTESRWQCPCFYLFNRSVLEKLNRFLEQDSSFKDATGLFLSFLVNEAKVCSYPVSGRYDIGNLNCYLECLNDFLRSK